MQKRWYQSKHEGMRFFSRLINPLSLPKQRIINFERLFARNAKYKSPWNVLKISDSYLVTHYVNYTTCTARDKSVQKFSALASDTRISAIVNGLKPGVSVVCLV